MALADITRAEVLAAIQECDRVGREEFRRGHGFRPARRYVLVFGGKTYDSKAIIGVAHGYLPGEQPLVAGQFSGGEERVARLLRRLGFTIAVGSPADVTADELVEVVSSLTVNRASGQPALLQPITLLWAISRARRGEPRLASWAETNQSLRPVLERFGRPGERPRPDYPVAALCHVGLWELHGHVGTVPPAHGDASLRRWFDANQPEGGLAEPVYDLIQRSGQGRAAVIAGIVETYFDDVEFTALLEYLRLSDDDIAADLTGGDAGERPDDPRSATAASAASLGAASQ